MALEPGAVIGQYEIVAPLGAGGMGEVYLATDRRLDRQVAIKVIAASVAGEPDRLRRFIREARTASSLSHPHIAHVYEIGEADGVHFIAMEYVRGDSLARRIGGKPMPPSDVIVYATQMADALDEAHSNGVIHRDLKPANAIISPRGRLKMLDFGLAKIVSEGPGSEPGMTTNAGDTAVGIVLGTIDYMSPEQVRGLVVDHRTDVFSFGVMVYEMLTGRLPFTGTSRTDTVFRITQVQPEAISRYAYDVPEELDRIVRKCLEKAREQRYQNVRDLLVDLSKLRRDSSAILLPVVTASRFKQHRDVAMAIAAIVIVIATIAIPAAIYLRPDTIESLAVVRGTAGDAGQRDIDLTNGLASRLVSSLSLLSSLQVASGQLSLVRRGNDSDPLAVARELGMHAALIVSVRLTGEAAELNVELVDVRHGGATIDWTYHDTRSLAEIQLAPESITSGIAEELNVRLTEADVRARQVNQFNQRGRVYASRRTVPDLQRAVNIYQQAVALDPNNSTAHAGLAFTYNLMSNYGPIPVGEAFTNAKRSAARALDLNPTLAEGHTQLGYTLFRQDWDWTAAERAFQRAISLDPQDAQSRAWLSLLLCTIGRSEEALIAIREAEKLDPLSASTEATPALVEFMTGNYEKAALSAKKYIELYQSFLAYRYLGLALQQLGKHDEAIDALTTALMKEGGMSTLVKGDLGHAHAVAGHTAEARRIYADLQAQQRRSYVSPFSLAVVASGLGAHDEALGWLENGVRTRANQMAWMKVDPRFAPLRKQARFIALLETLRLR